MALSWHSVVSQLALRWFVDKTFCLHLLGHYKTVNFYNFTGYLPAVQPPALTCPLPGTDVPSVRCRGGIFNRYLDHLNANFSTNFCNGLKVLGVLSTGFHFLYSN